AAATADSAQADTSAMAVARQALGPDVRMAIPFRIPHRNARFVAAAMPIMEWVPDAARAGRNAAPGGHEMVIVEAAPESYAVHKPGLYASREPFLPRVDDTTTVVPADSATLSRSMGVEDADGDGTPEVWAAQFTRGANVYHWEVRAYDRNGRALYTLSGSSRPGTDYCIAPDSYELSGNVAENPAVRTWLIRKLQQLDRLYVVEASGGTATCPEGAPAEAAR
ncbi:MAG TPA: hypothetical protein VEQ60_00200, partial [Longimicrobium sp.]|nr:hypothetical protein [Longimicrobium sp.]